MGYKIVRINTLAANTLINNPSHVQLFVYLYEEGAIFYVTIVYAKENKV